MEIEFDKKYKRFCDLPDFSVFVFEDDGMAYVKNSSSSAINLEEQTEDGFLGEDKIMPYTISKIILK